jgi:ribosomal protein S18 acetylase RimI-like enzyme
MAIRRASEADTDAVLDLAGALYREDGSVPFVRARAEAALRQLLADEGLGRAWVVEWEGTIVGYLVLTWGFSLEFHGRDAFVDEVYVAPAHRARGLGTGLLQAAEAACRERGVRALHLAVERSNERARALYRRSGFRERDQYLMTKRLEDASGTP